MEPSNEFTVDLPEPEPLDLFDADGTPMVRRILPAIGIVAVLVLVFVLVRRRRT